MKSKRNTELLLCQLEGGHRKRSHGKGEDQGQNWYIVIKILTNMLGYYTNIIKINSCSSSNVTGK